MFVQQFCHGTWYPLRFSCFKYRDSIDLSNIFRVTDFDNSQGWIDSVISLLDYLPPKRQNTQIN